jgi:transposase
MCAKHGVRAAWVAWERPSSGFTRGFEDQIAWLVTRTSKSTVCKLFAIAWRTVVTIIEWMVGEA